MFTPKTFSKTVRNINIAVLVTVTMRNATLIRPFRISVVLLKVAMASTAADSFTGFFSRKNIANVNATYLCELSLIYTFDLTVHSCSL